MMVKGTLVSAMALAMLMGGAQARQGLEEAPCGSHTVTEDVRLTVPAYMGAVTTLRFPAGVRDVVNAATDLWEVVSPMDRRDYVLVRPIATMSERDRVSVSVVTEDDRHYQFLFVAQASIPDVTCWEIRDERVVRGVEDARSALEKREADLERERRVLRLREKDVARRLQAAQAAVSVNVAEVERQAKKQAEEAIAAFRYSLNTAYDVTYSTREPIIRLAYAIDDGRYTYLRLADDAYGVPSVVAVAGDRTMLLQTRYDALLGEITVEGLHRRLELRHGAEKIVVERIGAGRAGR